MWQVDRYYGSSVLTRRRSQRRKIHGKGLPRLAGRCFHLARRFIDAVSARVDEAELVGVAAYLGPGEQALFRTMSVADQRHSLDLCQRLARDGHRDSDLLAAALLHDVGKSAGPLPLPHRVAYALVRLISPAGARALAASERPAWRQPLFVAAHHAAIGAGLAERAGSNARVTRLIRGHEVRGEDRLSELLFEYDRTM